MTGGRARLFVAILFPETVREAIREATREARSHDRDVRWVPSEQIHLTLRFLGSVERGRIEGLKARLGEVAAESEGFLLTLSGTGAFPRLSRPRVFWVGVRPTSGLGMLHGRVSAAVQSAGFEPEARPFRPHVTIGRVRRGREATRDLIDAVTSVTVEQRFDVESIALVESTLGPAGARHDLAGAFRLGGLLGPPHVNDPAG